MHRGCFFNRFNGGLELLCRQHQDISRFLGFYVLLIPALDRIIGRADTVKITVQSRLEVKVDVKPGDAINEIDAKDKNSQTTVCLIGTQGSGTTFEGCDDVKVKR